jgi:hypothetical protein
LQRKKPAANTGYAFMPAIQPTANSLQANAPANLLAHRIACRYMQPETNVKRILFDIENLSNFQN